MDEVRNTVPPEQLVIMTPVGDLVEWGLIALGVGAVATLLLLALARRRRGR